MSNYRDKKLLEVVREAPCQMCGIKDGTICAAHSNQLRDGKGKAIKAHDFRLAALCYRCHTRIDQGADMSKEERLGAWEAAHRATIGWLFLNEKLKVLS